MIRERIKRNLSLSLSFLNNLEATQGSITTNLNLASKGKFNRPSTASKRFLHARTGSKPLPTDQSHIGLSRNFAYSRQRESSSRSIRSSEEEFGSWREEGEKRRERERERKPAISFDKDCEDASSFHCFPLLTKFVNISTTSCYRSTITSTLYSHPVYFDLPIDRSRHAVSERNRFHDERKVQNTLIHGSSSGMAQVQPVFLLLLLLPLLLLSR